MYTNIPLMISMLVVTIFSVHLTIRNDHFMIERFELLTPPTDEWSIAILCLVVINFIVSLTIQWLVINWLLEKKIKPKLSKPGKSRVQYVQIEHELKFEPYWPPLSA